MLALIPEHGWIAACGLVILAAFGGTGTGVCVCPEAEGPGNNHVYIRHHRQEQGHYAVAWESCREYHKEN